MLSNGSSSGFASTSQSYGNGHLGIEALPAELLAYVVRLIYLESIPRSYHRNLDLHGLPSTYSDGRRISSPHSSVQQTLWALCLTSKAFFRHARPLLYRRIHVTLPYSFILLIRTLGAASLATAYEQFQQTGSLNQDPNDPESFTSMLAAAGFARVLGTNLVLTEEQWRKEQGGPDSDHLDLVWKQDSSSADLTSSSPRYTVSLRTLSDTQSLQSCIRVVDFSSFRTQGMMRTVGDGMDRRFVTSPRLLALLTAAPNLAAFGACQTMDSSLSVEVLEALLFRSVKKVHRAARLRGVSVERRQADAHTALAALDFTDCVSPVFQKAAEEFVRRHLSPRILEHTLHEHENEASTTDAETTAGEQTDEEGEEERGRQGRRGQRSWGVIAEVHRTPSRSQPPSTRSTRFASVERLSLHGLSWRSQLVAPFLLAFPSLTHLDLSKTRVDAPTLAALSSSRTVHLSSLSLAGCRQLSSEAITELLVDSPVTATLVELSLEGSLLFPTPLERRDLRVILTQSPCCRSGKLRYLDIGGCGLDDELLGLVAPQPHLLDLGIPASPGLTLPAVAQFLCQRAPNIQVLELTDSCFDPSRTSGVSGFDISTQLIGPCCATPPLPLSMQLAQMGFGHHLRGKGEQEDEDLPPPPQVREPTNLRVIGFNGPSLRSVRAGFGSWKVIWGSGKRGWLVDTSAGPNPQASDEHEDHLDHDFEEDDDGGASSERSSMQEERRARSQSRHARTGYEPETPSTSRHASQSPARQRSLSRGPHRQLLRPEQRSGSGSRSRSRASLGMMTVQSQAQRPIMHRTASIRESGSTWQGESPSRASPRTRMAPVEDADSATKSFAPLSPRPEIIRNLPADHPRRQTLVALAERNGHVQSEVGWHGRKMEVLLGFGLMGRERGSYAFASYS